MWIRNNSDWSGSTRYEISMMEYLSSTKLSSQKSNRKVRELLLVTLKKCYVATTSMNLEAC